MFFTNHVRLICTSIVQKGTRCGSASTLLENCELEHEHTNNPQDRQTAKPCGSCTCPPPSETAGRERTGYGHTGLVLGGPSQVRTPSLAEESRRRRCGTVAEDIVRLIFVVGALWPPASYHFGVVDECWAIEGSPFGASSSTFAARHLCPPLHCSHVAMRSLRKQKMARTLI